MRILHVDTGRELRGGQRQALLLAHGLGERGHQQAILARRNSPLYAAARERGLATLPLSWAALAREARRADLIHAHDARAHTLAALLGGGRPLVVSRRVAFPVRGGLLSRSKYRRVTRFLAVSEFVRERLREAGIPAEKISIVYDGVAPPALGPSVPREPFALAPASDDPQKGSDLAAEACRAAGMELRFSAALEDDLPRAWLFLYLTRSEGLGSAILLAMAHRTPVIASRVGGIPEIVADGFTGLLVENDAEAVAAAIRDVLADPAGAADRAEAAYAGLLARFTDAIMVAQTEQAYRLALDAK
ncbi:MAG TPA: glycosyltransferase family 4 protein [Bryobacterales bacterium]|nr:glycosyltransferase family 4 protein [Bryobacterales bacterium]